MSNSVKENQYRCECAQCGDTVSNQEYENLFILREQFPDIINTEMSIQLLSHTPMDDYKIYEVAGTLCLALTVN